MNKKLLLEKYIKVAVKKALKEAEEQQQKAEKAMYMVYRFPGLKKVMEELMSPAFGRYINNIDIVAPKPTTFKVDLSNSQDFTIIYLGRNNFAVKVAGKKYNPNNLGELERASQGISELLQLNYAPAEGKDQTSPDAGLAADLSAAEKPAAAAAGGETPPTEKPAEEETPPTEETPPAEK